MLRLFILLAILLMFFSATPSASAILALDNPSNRTFTFTEKELDALLPKPSQRKDYLIERIRTLVTQLKERENRTTPIINLSDSLKQELLQYMTPSFLNQVIRMDNGQAILTMPLEHFPIIDGETTITSTNGMRSFKVESNDVTYSFDMDFPRFKLSHVSPPVIDLTEQPQQLMKGITTALINRDYVTLSQYIDPLKGLTVTPYLYVTETSVTFDKSTVRAWLEDRSLYFFGYFDGKGHSIDKKPLDYTIRFIESKALTDPDDILIDAFSTHGNSLNNTKEAFPNLLTVIEYHHKGTDEFSGMDWRSLHFVFIARDGYTYLRAILSDEWTI